MLKFVANCGKHNVHIQLTGTKENRLLHHRLVWIFHKRLTRKSKAKYNIIKLIVSVLIGRRKLILVFAVVMQIDSNILVSSRLANAGEQRLIMTVSEANVVVPLFYASDVT